MKKINLPNETALILLCSRLSISSHNQLKIRQLLSGFINWDEIIKTSTQHETLPLVYYNLNKLAFQNIIPETIFLTMRDYYYINLKRNLVFEKEILTILALADQDKTDIIPFKGFSLIYTVYHNPGLRIMADVDILTKEDELSKIKYILYNLGYRDNDKKVWHYNEQFEIIFTKKLALNTFIAIEAHRALSPGRPYKINLPYLWQRTHKELICGHEMQCLSPEDTLLSLVLHLRRHTRRLTLKFIIDIAELLNKHGFKSEWHYIKKLTRNNHIITTMYVSLYLAKELLEADISSESINEFRPNIIKTCLIHLAINKYNFFRPKKWRGAFLRLLLFDGAIDFILYLWRVSFLERFITKITAINTGKKIKK